MAKSIDNFYEIWFVAIFVSASGVKITTVTKISKFVLLLSF